MTSVESRIRTNPARTRCDVPRERLSRCSLRTGRATSARVGRIEARVKGEPLESRERMRGRLRRVTWPTQRSRVKTSDMSR